MTQWEACVLLVCYFAIFCALKRALWLCEVVDLHVHLEDEKNRDTNKPGVKGTVAEISSCILGLGGTFFALRNIVWTGVFLPTE